MWLFLSDSFLSIVACTASKKVLLVRGRARGDIERVFPYAPVTESAGHDYRFRAFVPRSLVASAIAVQVAKIDYPNFKDSVEEEDRHDAYLRVWMEMMRFQRQRAHDALRVAPAGPRAALLARDRKLPLYDPKPKRPRRKKRSREPL